jgi:hypothetical protein
MKQNAVDRTAGLGSGGGEPLTKVVYGDQTKAVESCMRVTKEIQEN